MSDTLDRSAVCTRPPKQGGSHAPRDELLALTTASRALGGLAWEDCHLWRFVTLALAPKEDGVALALCCERQCLRGGSHRLRWGNILRSIILNVSVAAWALILVTILQALHLHGAIARRVGRPAEQTLYDTEEYRTQQSTWMRVRWFASLRASPHHVCLICGASSACASSPNSSTATSSCAAVEAISTTWPRLSEYFVIW